VARTLPFRRVSAARLVQQLRPLLAQPSYAAAAREVAGGLIGIDGGAVAADYIIQALASG
jgi:UDP:flavonoid glycosyltransferase YjiC (YdhE family)